MRPSVLNPLFADLTSLPGIGPKTAPAYQRLLSRGDPLPPTVCDLLCHMPSGLIDRRARPLVRDALAGTIVTVLVQVIEHRAPLKGSRAPYRVLCEDKSATLTLVFFNGHKSYLEKQLPVGETRIISGRLELFNAMAQIVHPDHIVTEEGLVELPILEPAYPLTAGVSATILRKSLKAALVSVPKLGEWVDLHLLRERQWVSFDQSVQTIHQPVQPDDATPEGQPWQRLAYDELLSGQLALALLRRRTKSRGGVARQPDGTLTERICAALPFTMTGSQSLAVDDILVDLRKPERMLRLLQGDVGAGKTVVGVMAMAAMAETGAQSALLAPTEILARQHYQTISRMAGAAGLEVALLTGRDRGKARQALLDRLKDGEIDILIGTHAVFQETVEFKSLGLAVIDEQHRFGVHQRLALTSKGFDSTEVLVMTATPIPRTLVLTYYGDMDVSKLTEKPAGRMPIETRVVDQARVGQVLDRLVSHAEKGGQAYWVCPLVEDGEEIDAVSATDRFELLSSRLGERVALIHGRMSPSEKDEAMAQFQSGEVSVLVATTVIEVGVDVPNASIMIIENAERFGLAQLHQLRGRVGRGAISSTCLLVYKSPLSDTAERRLRMMRDTEDGFLIAEEDLKLRGGGEILGTRQSGSPYSRLARPEVHGELLAVARRDAQAILQKDAELTSERGKALRILLHLFGRTDALQLIDAG